MKVGAAPSKGFLPSLKVRMEQAIYVFSPFCARKYNSLFFQYIAKEEALASRRGGPCRGMPPACGAPGSGHGVHMRRLARRLGRPRWEGPAPSSPWEEGRTAKEGLFIRQGIPKASAAFPCGGKVGRFFPPGCPAEEHVLRQSPGPCRGGPPYGGNAASRKHVPGFPRGVPLREWPLRGYAPQEARRPVMGLPPGSGVPLHEGSPAKARVMEGVPPLGGMRRRDGALPGMWEGPGGMFRPGRWADRHRAPGSRRCAGRARWSPWGSNPCAPDQ